MQCDCDGVEDVTFMEFHVMPTPVVAIVAMVLPAHFVCLLRRFSLVKNRAEVVEADPPLVSLQVNLRVWGLTHLRVALLGGDFPTEVSAAKAPKNVIGNCSGSFDGNKVSAVGCDEARHQSCLCRYFPSPGGQNLSAEDRELLAVLLHRQLVDTGRRDLWLEDFFPSVLEDLVLRSPSRTPPHTP